MFLLIGPKHVNWMWHFVLDWFWYHIPFEASVVGKEFASYTSGTSRIPIPVAIIWDYSGNVCTSGLHRSPSNVKEWNRHIRYFLKSTFEPKLWNKMCSMVTMHGRIGANSFSRTHLWCIWNNLYTFLTLDCTNSMVIHLNSIYCNVATLVYKWHHLCGWVVDHKGGGGFNGHRSARERTLWTIL